MGSARGADFLLKKAQLLEVALRFCFPISHKSVPLWWPGGYHGGTFFVPTALFPVRCVGNLPQALFPKMGKFHKETGIGLERLDPRVHLNDIVKMHKEAAAYTEKTEKGEKCMEKKKRKLKAPDLLVFTFAMMVIAMILTWVVPAGQYDRYFDEALGQTLVDPDSYRALEQTPAGLGTLLAAIPQGIVNNISVIAYVLTWGGGFGMVLHTKLIEDGLKSSLAKMRKAGFLILVVISFLFSAGGAFVGIQQSSWAFTPIVGVLATAMGYDIVTAFVVVAVANNVGFMAGPLNMWNVGVAQQISEVPLFSGLGMRMFIWIVSMVLLLGYLWFYCRKIRKDPTKSLVYGVEGGIEVHMDTTVQLSPRRKVAMALLIAELVGLVIMIAFFDMTSSAQIAAWLIGWGIVVAVANGDDYNEISAGFMEGVQMVLVPCIVVGMAGGILYILQSGNTLDTILHAAATAMEGTSNVFGLMMIYAFQFFFNLLVPSGTAQAATTMPIIAPLSDLIGVGRPAAILAFQFGDGLSNMIWPTNCLAPLAFTNIGYKRWIKWFIPFTVIWIIVSCFILVYANTIY